MMIFFDEENISLKRERLSSNCSACLTLLNTMLGPPKARRQFHLGPVHNNWVTKLGVNCSRKNMLSYSQNKCMPRIYQSVF